MTLLPHNPNAFTRSPLDRAGHHRKDEAWLKAALANPQALLLPFSKGRPYVFESGGGHGGVGKAMGALFAAALDGALMSINRLPQVTRK